MWCKIPHVNDVMQFLSIQNLSTSHGTLRVDQCKFALNFKLTKAREITGFQSINRPPFSTQRTHEIIYCKGPLSEADFKVKCFKCMYQVLQEYPLISSCKRNTLFATSSRIQWLPSELLLEHIRKFLSNSYQLFVDTKSHGCCIFRIKQIAKIDILYSRYSRKKKQEKYHWNITARS
jgi:hypothetical protein